MSHVPCLMLHRQRERVSSLKFNVNHCALLLHLCLQPLVQLDWLFTQQVMGQGIIGQDTLSQSTVHTGPLVCDDMALPMFHCVTHLKDYWTL